LQKILKKLNRVICDQLKSCIIKSKRVANYIIDNYNKINVRKFKNTIVSIEQKLLKIKIKNYFSKFDLIRILDAKLKKTCRTRV